jgi:hypothetical protein
MLCLGGRPRSYPNSGKLLRCFGKFKEDVCDDLHSAAKLYQEATKKVSK